MKKSIIQFQNQKKKALHCRRSTHSNRSQLINEGSDAEIDLDSGFDGLQFSEHREEFDGKMSDPSGVEDLVFGCNWV